MSPERNPGRAARVDLGMGALRSALVPFVAVLALPAGASAAWSPTATLDPAPKTTLAEAGTRIAIDAAGDSVAVWAGSGNRIRAASGDRGGHFGRSKTLGTGLRPTVAVGPDGRAVILWSDHGALRMSVRASRTARFGASRRLTATHARDGDDFPQVVARPNNRFVVVYENSYRTSTYHQRLRTFDVVRGANTATVELGQGSLARLDPVRVNAAGAVTVTGSSSVGPLVLVRPAGASDFTGVVTPQGAINGTAVAPDGHVAVGGTIVGRGGEAITLGTPFAARADSASAPFGAPLTAPQVQPNRAFGGDVAYDAKGRLYLFWQQKTASAPFSTVAPLYAAIAHPGEPLGRRLELDLSNVSEPQLAVSDRGVVAAWRGSKGQWEVALFSGEAGRPSFGSVPSGGPTLFHDFVTNRRLAAAGDYAALAWEGGDGAIHASVKRL